MPSPSTLQTRPKPSLVPLDKFEKIQAAYDDAKDTITEQEAQYRELQKRYDKIKLAKNPEEIRKIEIEALGENKQFQQLKTNVTRLTKELSHAVLEALYLHYQGGELSWPHDFGREQLQEEMKEGIQKQLLLEGPTGLYPNKSHPKIESVLSALEEMKAFLDGVSPAFDAEYRAEYKEPLSFRSRDFWGHFGL